MSFRLSTAAVKTMDEDDPDLRKVAGPGLITRTLRRPAAWVLLLNFVLIGIFTWLSPDHVFWSAENFQALALQGTQLLLISLGIALFMSAGFIDVSVGANLVLSSVIGAKVFLAVSGKPDATGTFPNWEAGIAATLVACLLTGVIFGLVNGFIIAILGVNSLIATLGTMGIAGGFSLLLTSGTEIGGLPGQLQENFGIASIGPLPLPTAVALVIALLMWVYFRYTKYGTYSLAIGSSRPSAERSGIRVKSMIMGLALTTGLLAGLAGFMSLAQYGATTISGHANDPLAAITAVVIGGTVLEGGRVSIVGTIFGVALAKILQSGLVIIGVPPFWQLVAIGVVLIVAVSIDRVRYVRKQR